MATNSLKMKMLRIFRPRTKMKLEKNESSKESFNGNITENHNRNSIDKVEYHILSNDHTNDTLIKNSEGALDDRPISNHKNHSTILINASINDISKTFSKASVKSLPWRSKMSFMFLSENIWFLFLI